MINSRRPALPLKNMIVAGIMSGTSGDGIDVALVRIGPRRGRMAQGAEDVRIKLLSHTGVDYPPILRRAVVRAMEGEAAASAGLARLNWRLGIAYAEAAQAALAVYQCRLDLVGCHGQTIYHQGLASGFAGRRFACTWQIGEMAQLAAARGVPVVSNFRPADMVAGGQGAPLVPLLDFVYFRHVERGRVLQNIGGIGNLTAIPPGARLNDVRAMDTGPGNMIIDAAMQRLFGKPYDRGGKVAGRGQVLVPVLNEALGHPFFRKQPPRSAGREQFGAAFAERFLTSCTKVSAAPEDAVATATALTAHSIADGYTRFVRPLMKGAPVDYFLSGGGARNATLTAMLSALLAPLGCVIRSSDEAGVPTQSKEAVAFALLAYQTIHALPGNVPSATGASRPAILGQITYA